LEEVDSNGQQFKFFIEKIKYENQDGSMGDIDLHSAQFKMLVSSTNQSVYFLTTMPPYSFEER